MYVLHDFWSVLYHCVSTKIIKLKQISSFQHVIDLYNDSVSILGPKKDTDLSSKQASESGTKLEGHSSEPGSSGDKVILNMPQLQEGTTLGGW